MAAGVEGIFLEVHPDPDRALCDGPNSVALADLKGILRQLVAIASAMTQSVLPEKR
jgi:2-dehydro-3-deoxyphosphooctonate aldolase (KDO 8-P synthase)